MITASKSSRVHDYFLRMTKFTARGKMEGVVRYVVDTFVRQVLYVKLAPVDEIL